MSKKKSKDTKRRKESGWRGMSEFQAGARVSLTSPLEKQLAQAYTMRLPERFVNLQLSKLRALEIFKEQKRGIRKIKEDMIIIISGEEAHVFTNDIKNASKIKKSAKKLYSVRDVDVYKKNEKTINTVFDSKIDRIEAHMKHIGKNMKKKSKFAG